MLRMNPRLRLACLGAGLALSLVAQAALNVVVTTADLAALAREIGGDRLALTTLTKPTEDPHFVDAKPSFIVKLNQADALIEGGAELEIGWLPPLIEGARNGKIAAGAPGRIACATRLALLEVPAQLDRSQGDLHAAGNPHYLIDPVNAQAVAAQLGEAFATLDPAGADAYRTNVARFTQTISTKLVEWQQRLAPYQGRRVVSYHNIWPYFARRFGLSFDLFLEPKPGIPPTPGHLAGVITRMKAEQIRVIIVEPFQNRRTAEKVAAATGATVVNVTQYPGGVKGTEAGYVAMLDYLVDSLVTAFSLPSR
jgi:ABC-type Zn uptake system ZnuABC Zn-binding protein ZnuA